MSTQPADLVIRNARIANAESTLDASIAVRDGKIIAVAADDLMPPAKEVIDARGRYVIPGAIDSHVHFRTPGFDYKEDWQSGTGAAARGGVTTVFEMPNVKPPTGTVAALKMKQEIAAAQAYVDYGIYGLLGEDTIDNLEDLMKHGVAGFKCFMGNTTGNLPPPTDGAMLEGFEILARHGYRCVVHAENGSIMERRQIKMEAVGRDDPFAHLAARPAIAAMEAVSRACLFTEWTGGRLHIAHKSSRDGLRFVRDAKARGVDVTVETCPQYLLLNVEAMKTLGGILRVNPPVREAGHAEALWEALRDGTIDMIATDHAPHTPEEKTRKSIWQCDCGFPGVETQMPLMLTEVNNGRMSINEYVRWACANPAKSWDAYPRKGVIQAGSDADLVMLDMNIERSIDQGSLFSKSKISPWHGRRVTAGPVLTIVRGKVVMRDGQIVAQPGWGKPVQQTRPAPHPKNTDKTTEAICKVRAG